MTGTQRAGSAAIFALTAGFPTQRLAILDVIGDLHSTAAALPCDMRTHTPSGITLHWAERRPWRAKPPAVVSAARVIHAGGRSSAAWGSDHLSVAMPSRTQSILLINLTYVSECLIPVGDYGPSIAMLLAHADKFNEANGVTGVLLFTGNHFAQTLEGPPTVVDQLMVRIGQDQRHKVLRTVDRHDVGTRKFKTWSMAYSGASIFIAGIVSRPLTRIVHPAMSAAWCASLRSSRHRCRLGR